MTDHSSHIKEIGTTLAPEYGPESTTEAESSLHQYYLSLQGPDRTGFVTALIV